ncbi:DUF6294 family protein [Amycolatopsis umgeniensis]|uniref:DUF6294 domain-containing protein n=1 Tax=Amycolatopsis umgeniensis TaxID=336628 RepID=A0A841AXN3_9PSEU|nr:DUF6294 family protein [Amycolatopsis umgeniensis]MBB5850868.1 hypothetical protein [Amycolatopsis umgeniensis]
MTTTARRTSLFVAMLVLAIGTVFATPASAGTEASTTAQAACTGASYCEFKWGRIRAGDCTMDNAKWILYRNGSASFEATIISSDSDDAWLMWPSTLDVNSAVLGPVHHGGDQKFVKGTVKNQWHWWFASGSFDAGYFDRMDKMRLTSHC